MRAPCLVACALAALAAGASPRQDRPPLAPQVAPARDSVSQARADGVIRGRVTLQGGNQPLHRVRIALSGSVQDLPTATTDVNG